MQIHRAAATARSAECFPHLLQQACLGVSVQAQRNRTTATCALQADYAALREGSLLELINLIDWSNVVLTFKAAHLRRVHGAAALSTLLLQHWLADIRANQAVRVLAGATPVAAFVRLGSAVHRLAADAVALPATAQVWPRLCLMLSCSHIAVHCCHHEQGHPICQLSAVAHLAPSKCTL